MGTTLSSIHIYTPNTVEDMNGFRSFSDGWQTYMPTELPEDPGEFRLLAKKVSKRVDAPVLWFYIFDSETICFEFYQAGKRVAAYSQDELMGTKNLYGIPKLVGYEGGNKRRLSRILSCADMDFQIELLEEYFGVCLTPFPDLLNEEVEVLRRIRGDQKYQTLLSEDREIAGKRAPIKAELVWEQTGKIFERKFEDDHSSFRPHHYYFGYDTFMSGFGNGNLRTVRFEKGQLVRIAQEEFDCVPQVLRGDAREDERIEEEFYPVARVRFTDKASVGFRGKTLIMPRGFYFFRFDERDRVLLTDEKGGLAVVDDSLKIIAKLRVKGMPVDYVDGHILTAGGQSFFAYAYNRSDVVRIYRLCDK